MEESRKRKHNREGSKSRQAEENFSWKSSTESGISPGLRRDSPTKGIQVHPRVGMIGIPSPELRETMKWIHLRRGHLVGSVANCMKESV